MAKICPLTGKGVIYLTCAECEQKVDCRSGKLDAKSEDNEPKKIKGGLRN